MFKLLKKIFKKESQEEEAISDINFEKSEVFSMV